MLRTINCEPTEHDTGTCERNSPPEIVVSVPSSSSSRRVRNSTSATAAIEASASPRKPKV